MPGFKHFGGSMGGAAGGGAGRRAALWLDFARGVYRRNRQRLPLSSIFTAISGGVNGTRVNSAGLIEAATQTNLLSRSVTPFNPGGGWATDGSATLVSTPGVLGSTGEPMGLLSPLTVGGGYCYQNGRDIVAGQMTVASAEIRAGGADNPVVVLQFFESPGTLLAEISVNAVTGAVVASSGLYPEVITIGPGHYRACITGVPLNTVSTGALAFATGALGSIGGGHYIGCAMLSQNPRFAFYVPTPGDVTVTATQSPRFDHDPVTLAPRGVLIEEQRTNLLTYSADFSNGDWFKNNVTAGASIASPTGGVDAALMQEDTANGFHSSYYNVSLGSVTGDYSLTGFLKSGGRDWMMLGAAGFPSVTYFNSTTVAVGNVASGATASIADFGGGWSRAAVSQSLAAVALTYEMILAQSNGGTTYAGDGASGAYPYGRQLEAGAFPTSYIPTTSAAVTRTADSLTMTGADFSSWWNQTEGTIVVKFRLNTIASGTTGCVFDMSSASNNTMICYRDGNKLMMVVVDANSVQFAREVATVAANTDYTFVFAYADGDFEMRLNEDPSITEVGTVPTGLSAGIGCRPYDLSTQLNGHIYSFGYTPARLNI